MRPIRHTLLILALGLAAVAAGGEPPETVEAQVPVVLWESPLSPPLDLGRAMFLLPEGTRCTLVPFKTPPTVPQWSCEVGNRKVAGFAQRAAFAATPKGREAVPDLFRERLRDYSGTVMRCSEQPDNPSEACGAALQTRMSLFWVARSLELRPPPALGTHPCAGKELFACVEEKLGSGMISTLEDEFVLAQNRTPEVVRLTLGRWDRNKNELSWSEPLLLHDPLLTSATANAVWRQRKGLGPEERANPASTFIAAGAPAQTFFYPRRLSVAPLVVCPDKLVRLLNLVPVRSHLREQANEAHDGSVLYAVYEYELPCRTSLVLGGAIPGLKPGPKAPNPFETPSALHDFTTSATFGPLTLSGRPAGSGAFYDCRMELPEMKTAATFNWCKFMAGSDLNGDGKLDFVIDARGDGGCGGQALWLSRPDGWELVAQNRDPC